MHPQDLAVLLALSEKTIDRAIAEVTRLVEEQREVLVRDRGPQGERGDLGPQGVPGDIGPEGPRGERGDRGERGSVGEKGDRGEPGEPGQPGSAGERGPQGERGEQGPRGPQGAPGEKGDRGEMGPPGRDGAPGQPGKDGRDGIDGRDGEKGEKGERGDSGDVGPQGEPGPAGKDGKDGKDGRDGKGGKEGPRGPKGDTGPMPDVRPLEKRVDEAIERMRQQVQAKITQMVYAGGGSSGGGGSSKLLDNDDVQFAKLRDLQDKSVLIYQQEIGKFRAVNIDEIIASIVTQVEVMYTKLVDTSGTFTYIGEAAPGTDASATTWRIKRVQDLGNGDLEVKWADGVASFTKVWNGRTGYRYS